MDEKQLQALYNAMNSSLDLGDYSTFKNTIASDTAYRKAIFNQASQELDLGDYNTWNKNIGFDSQEVKKQSPIPNVYDPQAQMKQSLGFANAQPSTQKKAGNDNRYLDFDGTGIEEVKPKPIVNKSGTPIGAAVGKDKKIGGSTAGAVYNSLVDLAGEIAGGGAYVGTNIVNLKEGIPYVPGVGFTPLQDAESNRAATTEFVDKARSSSSTKEQEAERAKFDVTDGVSGADIEALLFNIPKQLGGIAAGAGTGGATWMLQSVNDNAEELAANPNAKDLTGLEKTGYLYSQALAQAALEKLGLGLVLKSTGLGKKAQQKIVGEVFDEFVDKGKKATAKELENAIVKKASQFASKVKRVGLGTATGIAVEGTTEGTQQAAQDGIKLLTNKLKGKEIFDEEEITSNFKKNIINSMTMGAAMGGPLGGLTTSLSNTNKAIRRQIAEAQSPQDFENLQQQLNQEVELGNISEEEAQSANIKAQQYAEIAARIPQELDSETKYNIIGGIEQRNGLQAEIEKINSELEGIDPAFEKSKKDQLELLEGKLGEVNDYIESIVTGEEPKYKKGKDGTFVKITAEGEEIEITKPHYELATAAQDENERKANEIQVPEIIQQQTAEGVVTEPIINEGTTPTSKGEAISVTPETESLTETKPVEVVQAESDSEKQLRFKQELLNKGLPDKGAEGSSIQLVKSLNDKPTAYKILRVENKNIRELFTKETGVALPKTQSGTRTAIDEYFSKKSAEQTESTSEVEAGSVGVGGEVMYHTSKSGDLGDFNTKPIFFSSNKEYSEQYGSGKSKAYEVRIEKPFDTSDEQARKIYNEEFIPYANEKSKGDKRYEPLKEGERVPFTTADLLYVFLRKSKREGKDFGYDGVTVDEKINGEYSKFPLDRSQVKEVSEPSIKETPKAETLIQEVKANTVQPNNEVVSEQKSGELQTQKGIVAETPESANKGIRSVEQPTVSETKKQEEATVTDIGKKARDYAAKLRSGEEKVLPDWLQATLPKGTKKQGIDINEAFAKALETFADIHDKTKDFAKAINEGFKHLKDWFDENKIPYNEAELKEKFAQDRRTETEAEIPPTPPPTPPVVEGGSAPIKMDERRFTKQMIESDDSELAPESKAEIKKTLEYAVQTNAMSIQEASEMIKKVGLEESFALVMDLNNDMNGGVRGVLAQAIIKGYNQLASKATDQETKNFYYNKTINVADQVTKKLATESGRLIQSFSLWGRLTPEAQLMDAVKDMQIQGEAKKKRKKPDVNNLGNKIKKANEEAANEVVNEPSVKSTVEKTDSDRTRKAKARVERAKSKRANLIKKYKGEKGKNLFSTGVPGLSKEGIEFAGEVALTYIDEGIANVEILVEKIRQHLEEVSGKAVPKEFDEQLKDIADKRLNNSDLRLIGSELKEQKIKINDIIKQHYTVADEAKKSLAEKLIEKAGLTGEEAKELASKVSAAFDRIATRKKKRILFQEKARFDRIRNGLKGANAVDPKTLQGEIIRYSNLGAFENDAFGEMIAEKLGTGKLTPDETAKLIDLSDRVQKAPEGTLKNDATEDLLAYRANLKGTSLMELIQSAWYAEILSGYKTHEKNIVSTFFNVIGELSSQSIKNPKEAPFILYGFLKGARRGALEGAHTLITGRSPIHVKKIETPNTLERIAFKGGNWNPANWLKFVTRAMVAEDVLQFQGLKEARAYQLAAREMMKQGGSVLSKETWAKVDEMLLNTKERYDEALAQAKTEGLKSSIDIKRRVYELMENSRPVEMTEDAYGFAAEGTFNHETQGTLGALSNGISALVDVPIGGGQPLRFIVPFTRIITNVVNQALNYTPVGLVRAARGVRGFKSFEDYGIAKRTYVKLTKEQRQTLIAKASLGIGLSVALYALSKIKGEDDEPLIEITGGGTGDYKKDQQLRDSGWQEYSIKVGDTYVSYKLTPLIFMLGFFGNMNDKEKYAKTEDDATTLKQMELAMWRSGGLVADMSWINSAGTLLGALQEGAKNKEDISRSLEQSMKGLVVPQAYTQASQEIQNIFNMPQKRVENMWQNMVQDIPIARNSLNDKINVLGKPIVRDVDIMTSEQTVDPVLKFMLDNKVWVAPVNKKSMIVYKDGIEREATDDEYYEFSKLRGSIIDKEVKKLMGSKLYSVENLDIQQLEKGTKSYSKKLQQQISKIATDATEKAKQKLLPKDIQVEIMEDVDTSIENILNKNY